MYIIDHDKQIALIKEMRQLRKDSKKFEVYYHHPYTNQMWKAFFPQATGDDLGPKLLRHEPLPPNIEECLNICLGESVPENAMGLGIEWSAKPELWPQIVKALENRYSHYDRSQLKLFLNHLDLDEAKVEAFRAETNSEAASEESTSISADRVDDLIWRTKKVRLKRFFVFG